MPEPLIVVPQSVRDAARQSVGEFFEGISGCAPELSGDEHVDTARVSSRIEALRRYTPVEGKKLLEVGSGFGTNLAVFIRDFGIDGYGVEPDGEGFGCS